jgi:hypothetical protein
MNKASRILALSLLGLLAMVMIACGGESGKTAKDDDTGAANPAVDDEQFVANIPGVIAQSVQTFEGDAVTSMEGDVRFDFAMGSLSMAGNANFAVAGADRFYMTMEFEGGDDQSLIDLSELGTFEVLARDGTVYINMAMLGGWIALTPEDLGGDYSGLQELLSQGALLDYAGLVEQLSAGGQIEHVGQEEIDGTNTVHYRVSGDLQSLIGAFSGALSATGDNAFAQQILGSTLTGPVTIDLWLGTEDLLPYKLAATAEIAGGTEGTMALSLTANLGGYNESVSVPEAPAEAKTFAELFGDLGLATDSGE